MLIAFIMLGSVNTIAQTDSRDDVEPTWPGEKTDWNGFAKYEFEIDGKPAYVVEPANSAPGQPWVWRARFPNFHAETDLILLNRGFHIARLNTDGMLGSPPAMQHWDAFYQFVTQRGLAKKCTLEGVSRGGLFVYGFASRWPDRVAAIYCDTPVCDIRSWPGGKGTGRGHEPTWQTCLKEYGLTEETAQEFAGNPIDRLAPIAAAKIPILHIVSLNDVIVPPSENTFVLADAYRKLGGSIDVMEVTAGTETSGGHHFTHPDPVRVADFIELHGSTQPLGHDYFTIRGSLDNSRSKFETTKQGRVVFLGGSITTMQGWRDLTSDYLKQRFPQTEFEFMDAGISSTGSTPGAFRLLRDVFGKGQVDLLFEEAAVNDLHNMRTSEEMIRGMEGIVRHARQVNPNLDIVMMHFVDPAHRADYQSGKTPEVIAQHESVATHYHIPSLNLAAEVTDRIAAGQFDWEHDFKNCHPSPMGHRVYASSIRRLLSSAWSKPLTENAQPQFHPVPAPMDRFSYDAAKLISLDQATNLNGFKLVEHCDPTSNGVGGNVRTGFHDVSMLVGQTPGDSFSFTFAGRAVGVFVAAGPDAGTIEYSIDGAEYKRQNLFTKWSKGLHIPWVYVLESELTTGEHEIRIRVSATKNATSQGTACRIVNLLVNE